MTQNLQNLRKEVKLKLRARKYQEALEMAIKYSENQKLKTILSEDLESLENLTTELNEKKIDNSTFYYGINKIVSDTLDAVDEIIGEPDNDWDFVDELTSSLKFNLAEHVENDDSQKQNVVMTKVDNGQVSFEYEADFNDKSENNQSRIRIRQLYEQLNHYEDKLQKTEDTKEKAKIHSIIKAINTNISNENKSLKI